MRLIIVWLSFLVSLQIFFIILLFPSGLVSFTREKEMKLEILRSSRSSEIQNAESMLNIINETNSKMQSINSLLRYPTLMPILKKILESRTNNIKINDFSYLSSGADLATVSIRGISTNREALVSFTKRLEKLEIFKKVDSPVSNFTKDKNIDFSITLTVSK